MQRLSMRWAALSSFTLALLGSYGCQKQQAANAPSPPPPTQVNVAAAIQRDVPLYGDWVATLQGFQNAQIQPQVSGYLIRQNYREGSFVHKGEVLFEIDPRPFQAALDQAKGQVAQAKGQAAQTKAQLQLAEINVKRDTPLAAAHAIAQSQLDNDIQTRAQQQASVQGSQAAIESAEAAVETAELNLGFTKVRSLLDGIAGVANTQIGNLVSQTTILTTVSQVNPIKAYFSITEREYLQFSQGARSGDWLRAANATPLQLTLTTGEVYPHSGRILFADRQVNNQTGTILLVGSFANPTAVLRPGQFGRIRARTKIQKDALLIPQRAVTELQGRYQIAVVGADNKVSIRDVQVGPRVAQLWIIEKGLNPGDRVVTEGVSKVKDGTTVQPQLEKINTEGV
jgi:membrane fusion protein (multidrug efflux system)